MSFQTRRLVNHLKSQVFLGIIYQLGHRGSISTSYGSKKSCSKVVLGRGLGNLWHLLGSKSQVIIRQENFKNARYIICVFQENRGAIVVPLSSKITLEY